MAERIVVHLVDDISGAEIADGAGERIEFSVRGIDYRIDLSAANVAKFEKALAPYLDAATKVGGRRARAASTGAPSQRAGKAGSRRRSAKGSAAVTSKEQLAEIRDWAQSQGYSVAARGRIKAEIVEAFHAAH